MNEEFVYVVKGDPVPLARARYGSGRVYDAQKHLKLLFSIPLRDQHGTLPFYQGPLQLDITFFFKYPKSRANKYVTPEYLHQYTKPDLSNLIKFVEDVCQGILFKDDAAISIINAKKHYDHQNPRTEFTVRELHKKGE